MSTILPDIVSPSQGAFIKGRDIVGNILACQDLIRLYKSKTCSPRVLMKIDLQKAYDSVEWAFVSDVLKALGFPAQFIKLVMNCVTSPSYSIALNGESNIDFNGVSEGIIAAIEAMSGMKKGAIPFRYLGVTVSPKRLSVMDCTCLVEKLSYAGRLVLITYVLHTLHSYWARIFILSKTVIHRIDAICRKFLWHGKETKESPALVAWDIICRQKKQGGLRLKNLQLWNIAAIGKYVWWIESKADHLWVKWVHAVDGYKWLLPAAETVRRVPWVGNKLMLPKHKFFAWLVVQQRLLTQDRLLSVFMYDLSLGGGPDTQAECGSMVAQFKEPLITEEAGHSCCGVQSNVSYLGLQKQVQAR
ncbi:uncharacterized protein LOC141588455 [Silene latifolia]|uniref:uncharacterized protein LOC141588455 n=1 Tax=Silene latifolia TaxID=37657 RepID=UPI003D7770A5